jgi:acyl-coenzyme A synthetase/AMP-(fatty) acid ligase
MIWNFDTFGSNPALIKQDGTTVSYADILHASGRLVQHIPQRCLVFNLCANEPGSLLGYVTFLNNRIVPFLVESGLDTDLLASLLDTYRPDFIWCPSRMAPGFKSFRPVYHDFNYSLLKTPYNNEYSLYKHLALLLTTSGSTGSPKLVRLSYENIESNTSSIARYLKLSETQRPITTLPMSYTYGLSIINSHLYTGAAVILTDKTLMQKAFWQQLKKFKATSFGGVPYTYEMLDKLRFFRMDLPALQTMTQAGAKLSPELHRKFAEYAFENGKEFIVMYGQTEATARMAYLPPEKTLEKCGSMGIAIPGGCFSLINDAGKEIDGPDMAGELVYKGKNVSLGYAQCGSDLIRGDERNGVLVTGDIAKRDTDGYYYVVGRKKRFLKIFGTRINLDEVERMLIMAFPNISSACAGKDDRMFVFLTDDTFHDPVKRFLAQKTGLHFSAFRCQTVPQIPKNDAGKTLYKDLARYYEI